jgi:hypothetical protein
MSLLVATLLAVTAIRAPHPMAADPSLSDPAWQAGLIQPAGFTDLTKRGAAPLATRVYLLYDDRNLYVAFDAEQAGVPIVADQTTNNLGFGQDDFVGVAVDTSGAGNRVYFFETTPRGVRYQQSSENVRYAARWHSAAASKTGGWNAVLVIPLAILRLQPGQQRWRLNFIRSVASAGEHYTWSYDGLMADGPVGTAWPAFGDAKYWPTIEIDGSAFDTRPKPHAEIYTLASLGADRNQFQQANGTFGPEKVRNAGIDLAVPLASTINVVAALNPDFSNVEVDQKTIAPQEFGQQLVEYRPFFAQGASFLAPSEVGFSTPTGPNNQIFYTPGIGPFDSGLKIEGSFGLQSFGVLSVHGFDETTGNAFDDVAYGYKHATGDNTFAYWADGVIARHSVAGDDATTDAGLNVLNRRTGIEFGTDQALEEGSWVPDTGIAHQSQQYVAINKPNYAAAFAYNDLSPNYNPIDGYTFNSDIHGFQGFAQASGATGFAKNFTITSANDRWFDESGAVHEADTLLMLTATFKNGISIDNLGPSVGTLRQYDVPAGPGCSGPSVGTTTFTGYPCYRDGQDERFNLFTTALGYRDGTPAPVDASYAFGPFGGNQTQLFTFSTSRAIKRISIALSYDGTYERSLATGALNSQFFRRLSVGESLGPESNVSLSLQNINGLGGFAPQTGTNVALAYHQRFENGNELFVNYGTPAAYATLQRFIVKFVFHEGGDAGT